MDEGVFAPLVLARGAGIRRREVPVVHVQVLRKTPSHGRGGEGRGEVGFVSGRELWDFAQLGLHADAQVADEILVATPMAVDGGPAEVVGSFGGPTTAVLGGFYVLGVVAEFLLLDASVSHEGAEDEGIRRRRGKKEFNRGEERAVLLTTVLPDDVGHSVEGGDDDGEVKGEEENELDLALERHRAAQDDGDREDDEEDVGEDVARGESKELGETLTALGAWVGEDLPVVVEGLAFGEVADDDGYESQDDGAPDVV